MPTISPWVLRLGGCTDLRTRGRVVSGHANACFPSPAGPRAFIAEMRIITSREAIGIHVGLVRGGPDGVPACANLVRAGHVVTPGDVRAELAGMEAGWRARVGRHGC
jgi:hypothetical protein